MKIRAPVLVFSSFALAGAGFVFLAHSLYFSGGSAVAWGRGLLTLSGVKKFVPLRQPPSAEELLLQRLRMALGLWGIDAAWADRLGAGDALAFPDMLDELKEMPPQHQERLRELIFDRWAALDPEGGVIWLDGKNRSDDLVLFFKVWSRRDFAAAAVGAEKAGKAFFKSTLGDKARQDLGGLMAWLEGRPEVNPLQILNGDSDEDLAVLAGLLEAGPDKLESWIDSVHASEWDGRFLHQLLSSWATGAPVEALAWATGLEDPGKKAMAMVGVATALAGSDPERAVALLREIPHREGHEMRMMEYTFLEKLDLKDSEKAVGWAQSLPKTSPVRSGMIAKVLRGLLETDPAKGFGTAAKLGLEAKFEDFAFLPHASKTPERARLLVDAAIKAEETGFRNVSAKSSLLAWMESDPVSLAGYLKDKMNAPLLAGLKSELQQGLAMQQMLSGDANAQLVEVLDLPVPAQIKARLNSNPFEGAGLLDFVIGPGIRAELVPMLARCMTAVDREASLKWGAGLKSPAEQALVWPVIAEDWVREDPLKASEWLAGLPSGQGRDAAVLAMTKEITGTDPDLAWQWALSMTDPVLKEQALAGASKGWLRKDPTAFWEAIRSSPLTEAGRQALVEQLLAAETK